VDYEVAVAQLLRFKPGEQGIRKAGNQEGKVYLKGKIYTCGGPNDSFVFHPDAETSYPLTSKALFPEPPFKKVSRFRPS